MSTSSPEPAPAASSAPSPDLPGTPQADADAPVVRAADVADASRRRRAPRYGRFVLVGLLVAAALSLALTFVPVAEYEISRRDLFLLLLLSLGTVGVLAGLAWALASDRRSLRRQKRDRG